MPIEYLPYDYKSPKSNSSKKFREDIIGLLILTGIIIAVGSVMFAAGAFYALKYLCQYAH